MDGGRRGAAVVGLKAYAKSPAQQISEQEGGRGRGGGGEPASCTAIFAKPVCIDYFKKRSKALCISVEVSSVCRLTCFVLQI